MSYYGSRPTFSSGEKTYSTGEFRRNFPSSTAYQGDRMRHVYDLELAAAAAAYSSGPRYGDDRMASMRATLNGSDNCHYYGGVGTAANDRDHAAATKVLRSAQTGEHVVLSSHEAAHIRAGANWLADHKGDFRRGFVNQASQMYANVYDSDGRKVVDRRKFK
jgi:hypothetical protein